MKSIQEEIDKILSDNECCGEFGVWYEAVQKKVVKQLFQLFKTKWLEMVGEDEDPQKIWNALDRETKKNVWVDEVKQFTDVKNQLRARLRQQISKEEI